MARKLYGVTVMGDAGHVKWRTLALVIFGGPLYVAIYRTNELIDFIGDIATKLSTSPVAFVSDIISTIMVKSMTAASTASDSFAWAVWKSGFVGPFLAAVGVLIPAYAVVMVVRKIGS